MSKHIIFVSTKENYPKNDNFIKTKLLKKFNPIIYEHLFEENTQVFEANLVVIFGENLLWKRFPEKKFGSFFKDEDGQMCISVQNYKDYDQLEKKELLVRIKEIRDKLNKYFSRFALVRVADNFYFYRDIDFRKVKDVNLFKANYKFVEDDAGEFLSYDGKKLKKVSKDFRTFSPTYEEHLRSKDLFYYENYPNVAHTRILHYFTFDIETNQSIDIVDTPEPIVSIVAYSNVYDKTFVWLLKKRPTQFYDEKKFKENKIFVFDDERIMLAHFLSAMKKLEVDLLAGYNSDFFDVPYLLHRCKKLGVNFSVFLPDVYETIGKDGEKSYYCHEVILWDYLRYAKWIMIENKPLSWSLDAVSQHLLNEKKIEHNGVDLLWDNDNLTFLLDYNIRDVYLTEKIAQKQRLIEFPILYQRITPQTYENVYFNSRFLENLIHQRFKQFKFPSKKKVEFDSKFEGALVLETKPGIYENVSVYDFSSLYPSIMISLNLSKDTIIEHLKDFDHDKDIKVDEIRFSADKKGLIPQLSQLLVDERKKIKIRKDQHSGDSQEFKILNDMEMCFKATSNALYGVMGYPGFILYDQRVASSVTFVGREVLKHIKKISQEQGYQVLFADTDSVAVEIKADNFDKSIEKSKELEKLFNKSIPDFLRKFTKNEKIIKSHTMNIVFDKSFSKLLLSPAKKKQVGFVKYYKGKILEKEELNIKGFEAIKDDTPVYFKKVLTRLYENILNYWGNVEKLREFVNEVKIDLKKQSIVDLVIRKKMSKRMEEYDSRVQHVQAIKNSNVVLKRGETVNMVFVKDKREVLHYDPRLNLKFEIDYKKYYNDFIVKKIGLIDTNLHYHLFLEKTQLVDKSKLAIEKRIKRKSAKTTKLV